METMGRREQLSTWLSAAVAPAVTKDINTARYIFSTGLFDCKEMCEGTKDDIELLILELRGET